MQITSKQSKSWSSCTAAVAVPDGKEGYVNLSSIELTENQKELLNLGLNCHSQCKCDPLDKKAELEVLYQDVLKLQKENKVEVHPSLRDRLVGESAKVRDRCKSKLLTRALFKAAKGLREDDRIAMRRADKSSAYVIMDKEHYLKKMNDILNLRPAGGGVFEHPPVFAVFRGWPENGGEQRRRVFTYHIPHLFDNFCESFDPGSCKVRSLGQVKWPYLTKNLRSRPSYSVWGKVMKLSEYDKVIGTYKMYIFYFWYRWP